MLPILLGAAIGFLLAHILTADLDQSTDRSNPNDHNSSRMERQD
jgi:hypothetical protein